MSTVSCLPKPREIAILGDRQISYDAVELEWSGEYDSKVDRYFSSLLGSSKLGKILIDISESQSGLPTQGRDESYLLVWKNNDELVESLLEILNDNFKIRSDSDDGVRRAHDMKLKESETLGNYCAKLGAPFSISTETPVINTNIKSLVAQDVLTQNSKRLAVAMERLSTGKRINSATDDATGLAIVTKLDSQTRGLQTAIKNANDSISAVETAEGAMQEVTSILQRMRELALQASSDTNSDSDRAYLQNEVNQLSTELDRISTTTQYNAVNLLDGSYTGKVFQIGSNGGQTMNISIGSMGSNVLGAATSNSGTVSSTPVTTSAPVTSSTVTTGGSTAKGTDAVQTVVNLEFLNNSGSDAYKFLIVDSLSGLTAEVSNLTVDMTNSVSKDAFVAALNLSAATGQTDTTITAAAAFSSAITGALDITNSSNYGKVRFAISVDGGATTQIDLRDKLVSTAGVDSSSVTQINALPIPHASPPPGGS